MGERLKLSRVHPHKFRRTMATTAIDKGMPIEQVQVILELAATVIGKKPEAGAKE